MTAAATRSREAICRIGASLFARGHAHGTAGNISLRLAPEDGGGFLVTPTDACLGFLDPARLAHVDEEGVQRSGDRASKTLALHRAVYAAAARHDAGTACIVHTHAHHAVASSLGCTADELLPPLTAYFVMKVGRVPLIAYARPGDPRTAELVARAIDRHGAAGRPIRAVMLQRLGPVVWHDDADAALAVHDELEATARLALQCPDARPLDEAQIDELRRAFAARW